MHITHTPDAPAAAPGAPVMGPFTLPPLPYAVDALEPHIDARTMEIHHSKHHQTYITNLNKALEGSPLADWPVEQLIARLDEVPEAQRPALRSRPVKASARDRQAR